jgi:hypothetical protein
MDNFPTFDIHFGPDGSSNSLLNYAEFLFTPEMYFQYLDEQYTTPGCLLGIQPYTQLPGKANFDLDGWLVGDNFLREYY